VLPPARRGAYAENSAGLVDPLTKVLKSGDTVLVKGSLGSRMAVIVEALKSKVG
jgi:UDP-N-acetylmuramoyl-tripeptide--D-alanyl-D-alanine ligase